MKDYGKTYSACKPEDVRLDENGAWVADSITETQQSFEGGSKYTVYEYQLKYYAKDEYILDKMQQDREANAAALAEAVDSLMAGRGLK